MALDFPANPVDGQAFGSYVWSAAKGAWQGRDDSATVAIMSPVAPSPANPGDLWINTSEGIAFVYYDDGSSAQWIEVLASPSSEEGGTSVTIDNLNDISDVNVVGAESGNSLIFDGILSTWVPSKDIPAIKMNTQTILTNTEIPSGYNGVSAGPITIASGVTVTIPDGSAWSIV
jgi:hypothetical protein